MEFEKDSDKWKKLQTKKHGGWNEKMQFACGIRGIVNRVKSGTVFVEGVNGDEYVCSEEMSSLSLQFLDAADPVVYIFSSGRLRPKQGWRSSAHNSPQFFDKITCCSSWINMIARREC